MLAHKPEKPPAKFFPYPIYERTLGNGLRIMIVPTPEFKDMVSYTTPVFAGSRNETEKGKTGLAHLFEHIMFRHEYNGVAGGYQEMMDRLGSYNNAYTTYDMTFYHPFTFAQNLVGPVQTAARAGAGRDRAGGLALQRAEDGPEDLPGGSRGGAGGIPEDLFVSSAEDD